MILSMILQNILMRFVGYIQVNIFSSNILPARFHQNCQVAFSRSDHTGQYADASLPFSVLFLYFFDSK